MSSQYCDGGMTYRGRASTLRKNFVYPKAYRISEHKRKKNDCCEVVLTSEVPSKLNTRPRFEVEGV